MTNLQTNPETQATPTHLTVRPRYDVREDIDAFTLTAWLPGVDRSSLETTLDDETLTIVGRRTFAAPAEWTLVHREIQQADYQLELVLDSRINREAIKAELSQGLLTLTLPKAEATKPRRIDIQG